MAYLGADPASRAALYFTFPMREFGNANMPPNTLSSSLRRREETFEGVTEGPGLSSGRKRTV